MVYIPCSCSLLLPSSQFIFYFFLFLSDTSGDISLNQQEEPIEGGDLHLTCVANKYLFTALKWHRVNNTGGVLAGDRRLTEGVYSNSLELLLRNLTARDSGIYRCSARHLITGRRTHRDTQVKVKGELYLSLNRRKYFPKCFGFN